MNKRNTLYETDLIEAAAKRESYDHLQDKLLPLISPSTDLEPLQRHTAIRELGIAAGNIIHLDSGFDLPSAETSEQFLDITAGNLPAIKRLVARISLSKDGCWMLPLPANYVNGVARYPNVSGQPIGRDRSVLAHRYTVMVVCGPDFQLSRDEHVDHLCRIHACCNPMHLEVVSHAQNTRRGARVKYSTGDGKLQDRLPDLI